MCGGGVSVYYSHTLKMLFFSFMNGQYYHMDHCMFQCVPLCVYEHAYVCGVVPYMNAVLLNLSLTHTRSNKLEGESFMGSPNSAMADVRMVVHIPLKANGSGTGGSSGSGGTNKPPGPALVQWTEVQHHPGLVCAVFQVRWTETVFTLTHLLSAYSYALTYT